MQKIKLPECGIFVGSGVYNTSADYLICTMPGHYTWTAQTFSPMEMIDRILEDNQGNLAQVWGYARGLSPRMRAEWFYALDEIGVQLPDPDWEQCRYLNFKNMEIFRKYEDRFGAGLVRFLREARKRGLYTAFIYTSGKDEWVRQLKETGGEFYLGYDFGERYNIGFQDAEAILKEGKTVSLGALADRLIERVKTHVDERHAQGWGLVMATSSNFSLDYEVFGGAEVPVIEDFAFPNLNFSSGFSRGLYRQYDLPLWGSHLAHEHYAWLPNSHPRRYDLLSAAMYLKYMAGSKMIINESGNWFVEHTLSPDSPKFEVPQRHDLFPVDGNNGTLAGMLEKTPEVFREPLKEARSYYPYLNYDSPTCRRYRETISDFWNFVKANGTPEGQPESSIALVKGNCDLCTARYNHNYAIAGLYPLADENPAWLEGMPERSWDIAKKVFFPLKELFAPYRNHFLSGTPYGQVDVVSFAKDNLSADFLKKNYKALLFTGWNTSSEKQYEILKEYVAAGGTLFLGIAHLCKNETRNFNYKVSELVNGGDFSELCEVKVGGRGQRFYWATAPAGSDTLGFRLPRRFGITATPLGDIEIVDPDAEILVINDENAHPVILRHSFGKGNVFFLNAWAYPGAFDNDDGPGGTIGSAGLIGTVYRHIANHARGRVCITGNDLDSPDEECDYVAFSYFPEDGTICLLNVDFDHPHSFRLHHFGVSDPVELAPAEFRMIHTAKA